MAPTAEMNCDNCFVHKVGSYPLIAGLTQHALYGYEASKSYRYRLLLSFPVRRQGRKGR